MESFTAVPLKCSRTEESMLKRLWVLAVAATFAARMGYADRTTTKVTIPVKKTAPTSGSQMYANYCAPCHGLDGRGHGALAAALRRSPSDLTVLTMSNRGRFPDTHIAVVLQNGIDLPSHGTAEMPVWGPILGKMDQAHTQDRLLRISNLSRYLESIQANK